jgi:hypothetical protein
METNKIKLIICYHKPDILFKDEIITPIHLGRSLAIKKAKGKTDAQLQWLLDNMIGDDTGDNISNKNESYNELTGIYWAWKNYEKLGNPEFIGVMHYRRHFYYGETDKNVLEFCEIGENYFKEIGYDPNIFEHLLDGYDFAAHISKVDCIRKHYADNHKLQDLNIALKIMGELYPEYIHTASQYINQGEGCFCNMFIFPKFMFFDYCKWLFSILDEFEKKVDISEKRLFISERLTGIYIAKAIEEGKKVKKLPIVFIKEPIKIPIALPFNKSNMFLVAVNMISCLENADKYTSYDFYLLVCEALSSEIVEGFTAIAMLYKKCSIQFVNVPVILSESGIDVSNFCFPEHYPLVIQNILPKINKIFYFSDKILALKDLSEFYRTCSVDDFWINGIPLADKDSTKTEKKIANSIFVMNLARLRKHNVIDLYRNNAYGLLSNSVFNLYLFNEIGYIPEWFYTSQRLEKDYLLFDTKAKRAEKQFYALWKHILEYPEGQEPWINIQGVYSIFWWDIARLVPATIPFFNYNFDQAVNLLVIQQTEINQHKVNIDNNYQNRIPNKQKLSLVQRVYRYYKKNGFIATLQKIIQKTIYRKRG